jgi:hypothetical protein
VTWKVRSSGVAGVGRRGIVVVADRALGSKRRGPVQLEAPLGPDGGVSFNTEAVAQRLWRRPTASTASAGASRRAAILPSWVFAGLSRASGDPVPVAGARDENEIGAGLPPRRISIRLRLETASRPHDVLVAVPAGQAMEFGHDIGI